MRSRVPTLKTTVHLPEDLKVRHATQIVPFSLHRLLTLYDFRYAIHKPMYARRTDRRPDEVQCVQRPLRWGGSLNYHDFLSQCCFLPNRFIPYYTLAKFCSVQQQHGRNLNHACFVQRFHNHNIYHGSTNIRIMIINRQKCWLTGRPA